MGKYDWEYEKGKCEICSKKTEVQRRNFDSWCCTPCLERMKNNQRKRASESNLNFKLFNS